MTTRMSNTLTGLQVARVPFVDTRADQLVFSTTAGPVPAVCAQEFQVSTPAREWTVQLAVLGCSHQVTVSGAGGLFRETLACLPAERPYLPARHVTVGGGTSGAEVVAGTSGPGATYLARFAAQVIRPGDFTAAVRDLELEVAAAGRRVAAAFPGDSTAVTALTLADTPRGFTWKTWHCYPQANEIVTTVTRFEDALGDTPVTGTQREEDDDCGSE